MEVGKKLKLARERLKLTQKQLASKIKNGIDYSYIGKIERNDQNPSLNIIIKIAEALNIKLEYFFSDKSIEYYLQSETKTNQKRSEIMEYLSHLDEEESNFVIGIIKFLQRYTTYKKSIPVLKVAEKRSEYKTSKKNR